MYCNYCGKQIQDDARYCAYCGRRAADGSAPRPLVRVREGRKLAGVCQGFAEYAGLDVTLVRIIALLLAIFTFPLAEVAYVIAWIVMPEAPARLPQASYPVANTQI
jgi:phage shock protein C